MTIQGEQVLNLGNEGGQAFVAQAVDPVILPQPYVSPADFAAQYPTPLDTNEIVAMCEEINLWMNIPDDETALRQHTWRELNSLAFTSGSSYISFADGECPEEYTHDGSNSTITLKNIGAKKTLSLSDIKHSMAVAAANWHGINRLTGPAPSSEGISGGTDAGTFQGAVVASVKDKEQTLAATLVMNGWDRLLALGDSGGNSLEFTGIQRWQAVQSCNFHTNDNSASGTFAASAFNRYLSEGCAKPTTLFGHPQAIQEVMQAYFQLGFNGSQVVNFDGGNRLVPGFNFAGQVNTGVGLLNVVADSNFTRTNIGGGAFQASIWAMRMTHNGVPLVQRLDQFRLGVNDLVPGCTAVSFQVWAKTALIIKHCCAHGQYISQFTGRVVSTCPVIG